MALLAQRHRDWGCLLVLPPQTSNVFRGSLRGCFRSPTPKKRTSPDISPAEGASLESCCSASCVHGTARTEAQRLGLLASLATSNFKCSPGGPCRAPFAALLRKCERLQIPHSQKGAKLQSCCSASSARGTACTETQRLGLLASLLTSNFKRILGGPFMVTPGALLRKCERLQIARRQKVLAWKAVAQPHLPMALLAQRHRDWGCLIVLPPQTSNISLGVRAGSLQ